MSPSKRLTFSKTKLLHVSSEQSKNMKDCCWWQRQTTDFCTRLVSEQAFLIDGVGSQPPQGRRRKAPRKSAQRIFVGPLELPLLEIVSIFGVLGILFPTTTLWL